MVLAVPNPVDRLVAWCSQEGAVDDADWVPTVTNTAGSYVLPTTGSIVCGRRSRGVTLIWTNVDLWAMTYIGGEFVFRFDQVGNNCGIIS
ncbi:MAG: hypothetical protein O2854_07000, partial [Chloroflexi bacterium]|nr:hypothetical protein [Chloroflexota bacterium]